MIEHQTCNLYVNSSQPIGHICTYQSCRMADGKSPTQPLWISDPVADPACRPGKSHIWSSSLETRAMFPSLFRHALFRFFYVPTAENILDRESSS